MGKSLHPLLRDFFESEKSAGLILMVVSVVAMLWANSPFSAGYHHLWETPLYDHGLRHWVNDGLMAIFFLLIGLELERELYSGELSDVRSASLPILAALGGMAVPAAIFYGINAGLPTEKGWGIPMATDIAFALGVLSFLGNRVPITVKILLSALAVIDDLGAILVIAFFYGTGLSAWHLGMGVLVFLSMLILNRLKVHLIWPYLLGGGFLWYFLLHSGLHATLAGVLTAFALPFADGKKEGPSYRLQHMLHKPVAFLILPLFALANTGITLGDFRLETAFSPHFLGIGFGLLLGKPLGILLACLLATRTGIGLLPPGIRLIHLVGMGFLAGIGFTMSVFIALLAFPDPALSDPSKLAILAFSLLSGGIGYALLFRAKIPARTG